MPSETFKVNLKIVFYNMVCTLGMSTSNIVTSPADVDHSALSAAMKIGQRGCYSLLSRGLLIYRVSYILGVVFH